MAARGGGLSLRALEENDRVAKRISKRGCESGRNFNPRLCPRVSSPVLCLLSQFRLVLSLARSKLRDLAGHVSCCAPSFDPLCLSLCTFVYCTEYMYICMYIYIHDVEDFRLRDKRLYSRATRNGLDILVNTQSD